MLFRGDFAFQFCLTTRVLRALLLLRLGRRLGLELCQMLLLRLCLFLEVGHLRIQRLLRRCLLLLELGDLLLLLLTLGFGCCRLLQQLLLCFLLFLLLCLQQCHLLIDELLVHYRGLHRLRDLTVAPQGR